ncbi:MAG: hypothetical protein JNL10_18065 [Verrucomicrobiales bacterium]|nr:hypothetical protein [Verrucomicrobiales bacterium]
MSYVLNHPRVVRVALGAGVLCAAVTTSSSLLAKGGATDPIPGTSKSGLNSGGGGGGKKGGSVTPTPAPAPAPAPQPIVVAPLTFTANATLNGIAPYCTGSYRVDPYYPTLSLMTVSVNVSLAAVPDGTVLLVNVNGTGGTLYPFTSNQILVTAQSGTCSYSEYLTPGTTIQSVVITDLAGNVLLTGN